MEAVIKPRNNKHNACQHAYDGENDLLTFLLFGAGTCVQAAYDERGIMLEKVQSDEQHNEEEKSPVDPGLPKVE